MRDPSLEAYFEALDAVEADLVAPLPEALSALSPQDFPPRGRRRAGVARVRALNATAALPPVAISHDPARGLWRLEQEYQYTHAGYLITVPAGFEFDLASVPRAFWVFISPFDLSIVAPLLHDFLYHYRGDPPAGAIVPAYVYTRLEADDLFLELMVEEGVPRWRREVAYRAVRTFGGVYWVT